MKTQELKDLNRVEKKYIDWKRKMRGAAIRYITSILREHGDITYDYDNEEQDCVVYNGGNHPEYASNAFSEVKRVYFKQNMVWVETEDADIDENELSTDELLNICITIRDNVIPRLTQNK